MSADGNAVVLGGYWNDSNGADSGLALVYKLSATGQQWVGVGQELIGEAAGDQFGISMSIAHDGTRISIGSPLNDGNGEDYGQVRVYELQ